MCHQLSIAWRQWKGGKKKNTWSGMGSIGTCNGWHLPPTARTRGAKPSSYPSARVCSPPRNVASSGKLCTLMGGLDIGSARSIGQPTLVSRTAPSVALTALTPRPIRAKPWSMPMAHMPSSRSALDLGGLNVPASGIRCQVLYVRHPRPGTRAGVHGRRVGAA